MVNHFAEECDGYRKDKTKTSTLKIIFGEVHCNILGNTGNQPDDGVFPVCLWESKK